MKKTEQKILKYLDEKNLIVKNDKILVALSGGPDSVFLLHFLFKYKRKLFFSHNQWLKILIVKNIDGNRS